MAMVRNVLFGALAGAAATVVMTQFQNRTQPLMQKVKGNSSGEKKDESSEEGEATTTKVADKIYSTVRHSGLPKDKKDQAGQWVHYAFGTLMGGGFGALASTLPQGAVGRGLIYGSLVWLIADEIGVSVAGLSPPPWKVDGATHAYALLSHLVYGAALSGVYSAEERIAA
ncbi:MAG: hypothetical protein ACJ763_09140 [Bdellovibrionia bacterium]